MVREKHELTLGFDLKHLLEMIRSLPRRRIVRLQAVGELRFGDKMPVVHVRNVLAGDERDIFCFCRCRNARRTRRPASEHPAQLEIPSQQFQ